MNSSLDHFDPRTLNCTRHDNPLVGIVMKNYGEGNRLLCIQCLKKEAKSKTVEFEEIQSILTKQALDIRLNEINLVLRKQEKLLSASDQIDKVFEEMINVLQYYRREFVKMFITRSQSDGTQDISSRSKTLHRNLENTLQYFADRARIADGEALESYVKQFILLSKSLQQLKERDLVPMKSPDSVINETKFILKMVENNLAGLLESEKNTTVPSSQQHGKRVTTLPNRPVSDPRKDALTPQKYRLPAMPIRASRLNDNPLNISLIDEDRNALRPREPSSTKSRRTPLELNNRSMDRSARKHPLYDIVTNDAQWKPKQSFGNYESNIYVDDGATSQDEQTNRLMSVYKANPHPRERDMMKRYEELTTDDEQNRSRRKAPTPAKRKRSYFREPIDSQSEGGQSDDKATATTKSPRKRTPSKERNNKGVSWDPLLSNISGSKGKSQTPERKRLIFKTPANGLIANKKPQMLSSPFRIDPEAAEDFNVLETGIVGITSLAYLEGYKQIAIGGFKSITLVDTSTWLLTLTKNDAHKSYVNRLFYSEPLKLLFSCSGDGLVKSWSVYYGGIYNFTLVKTFAHPGIVYGMEIYSQETLISCGMFKSIFFWDINDSSKKEIRTKGSTSFQCVKAIPWLNAVAASSFDQGNIWIFELGTYALKYKLNGFERNTFVSNIEFDVERKLVFAAGTDGRLLVWDVDSHPRKTIEGKELYNSQKRFKIGGFSLDMEAKKVIAVGCGRYHDDCILISVDLTKDREAISEASVFRNQKSCKFSMGFADIKELDVILFGLMTQKSGKLAVINRSKIE